MDAAPKLLVTQLLLRAFRQLSAGRPRHLHDLAARIFSRTFFREIAARNLAPAEAYDKAKLAVLCQTKRQPDPAIIPNVRIC